MPATLTGIAAVAFDVNGTLVHIETDEHRDDIFRAIGHFLTYQGIDMRRHQVRDEYFRRLKRQQRESPHRYPEFDAVAIFQSIIDDYGSDYTRALPPERLAQLPLTLAEIYRGVSRKKLKLYPHVRKVLGQLRQHFALAIVTDAQTAYALGELHKVGLTQYFDPIIVSGDHGFRKPDVRLFEYALAGLGVPAAQTVYIGNDMFRDIYGAREAGMRTIMFDSDQGTKDYDGCKPDFRITDHRELLQILGVGG
ncbi:HAD family hydrolase [Mycobacterium paraterrae]|uniref:HAD family hydrolase n=1 Tax=Mycobacterium paraterrae TaxID=577492 RepID=A0ABY3VNY5_9MYCO|nr:HAD family hydrolase [Mycobacterium paraterrae]UMB70163.1 HAD family hydrolase [Mycobacterium paraterrae]